VKFSPLVNVNVKRNDTSVDVNFSLNFAMAALRYSGPLPWMSYRPNVAVVVTVIIVTIHSRSVGRSVGQSVSGYS